MLINSSSESSTKVATKGANDKTTKPSTRCYPSSSFFHADSSLLEEPKEKRAPTPYNLFVKANLPKWKAENSDKPSKEAMAGLRRRALFEFPLLMTCPKVAALWKDAPENPKRGKEVVPRKKKAAKVAAKEPSSSDTEA